MNEKYVKIRSWHLIATMTRGGQWLTKCGRAVPGTAPTAAELPAEKSCETCLRIEGR